MAEYRNDLIYKKLERLAEKAGFDLKYRRVPDDHIDGEIWARSDIDSKAIMMPDTDEFPDPWTATRILGHEMAHLLLDVNSPDAEAQRLVNEQTCDLVGLALASLAGEMCGAEAEEALRIAAEQEE